MSSIAVLRNGTEGKNAPYESINQQDRILSLSGGGVKGIAELVVLAEIEERTGKSISELFPIITGTSVGGLVAGLLTIPKEQGSKEPKYSAKEALEIFKNAAPKIFEKRWYRGIKQVFQHKYSSKALQDVLEKELGNNRLSNSTSRLIIPVTDLESDGREVKLFDSRDSYSSHIKTKDVLLATTAAPTYFKAVSNREDIKNYTQINKKDISYNYVDGGLAANRPMYEVLKRLKQERKGSEAASQSMQSLSSSDLKSAVNSNIFGVSLSFNNEIGSYTARTNSKFDGILGWLSKGKLVDRLLKSSEDAATDSVRSMLKSKDRHIELTIPITKATSSLDDASPANIAALEELGRKLIKEKDKELNDLCKQLVESVNAKASMVRKSEVGNSQNLNASLHLNASQTIEKDEGYESGSEVGKEQAAKHLAESTKLQHTATAATQDKNIKISNQGIKDRSDTKEIFDGMEFVSKKSGGANEAGKYGGIYRSKLDGNLSMVKQERNISKNISEYMGSRVFAAVSKGNGAKVILRAPKDAEQQLVSGGTAKSLDKEIYVESKFLKDYSDDMYADMDKHMSAKTKPSSWFRKDGARPLFVGSRNKLHSTLDNAFKELRYEGFEDIMPASLLIGDFDVHVGNIGVTRDSSKPEVLPQLARIDFAGSFSKLEKNIYPHSRMKHLPGFGPTNHFREFPSEMRRNNKKFGCSLIESSKQDLSSSIEESFKELSKYYSMSAIKEWAEGSGAISTKNKDTLTLKDIEQSFKKLMHARQESLRAFGMEVLLSSVVQKGIKGTVNIDEKQLKELVASYREEFKAVLAEYEKTGKLKLSKKEYRTKATQEKLIQEIKTMITDMDKEQTKQAESRTAEIPASFKSKYGMKEQQPNAQQESIAQDSVSFGASVVGISLNSEGVDPITEAIRKEILEKQREQLRLYLATLSATRPELAEHTLDDERFKKFLNKLTSEQRELVNSALASEKVKAAMEQIEISGYQGIHTSFNAENYKGGFKPMDWSGFAELNTRSQIVQNGVGDEICTLKEQTHTTKPLTISKQDGSVVLVNSYRTIDFPVELHEPASGTMHLSLVAKDKDGNSPSTQKAVYFTAHYEATPKPNGVPKLTEVSSPQPIKFLGSNKEAIGYIEHGGEIYTLPVTKGKYEEMMKEVAKNKGQAIDLSLAVESKAQDLISSIEQVSGAETGRVTGEEESKSGLAEKVESEQKSQAVIINNPPDSKEEQIKYHEEQIAKYKKILEEHIEPALNLRDQEREKILELTKKYLTEPKYKEFESYIKKTAEQHIELHHEAYLKEADGGKALKELTEIMQNIGYKGIETENSKNSSRGAAGTIKDVLKAGGKLGFNVVLESLKRSGIENYVKQKAIEESKKVGSYVAHCVADRIRATLSGKAQNSASTSSSAAIKQNVIGMNGNTSKSLGVGR